MKWLLASAITRVFGKKHLFLEVPFLLYMLQTTTSLSTQHKFINTLQKHLIRFNM